MQKKSQNASGQAGAARTAMTAALDAAQMQAFEDDGVSIGGMRFNGDSGRIDGVRQRSAKLRQVMDPQRRHVAMDDSTLERLVGLWEEEWPPTLRARFRL